MLGRNIPGRGVLMVKDPLGVSRQEVVPGLLGMNVIGECYRELFVQQGEDLFSLLDADQAKAGWGKALRHCHRLEVCSVTSEGVLGRAGDFVPAGSLKFVKVTCPKVPYTAPKLMLLEPGGSDLAPGLLLSPSLVTVVNGVTYVPVVNVGVTGATVHAKQVLGKLHQVEGIEGQQLNLLGRVKRLRM